MEGHVDRRQIERGERWVTSNSNFATGLNGTAVNRGEQRTRQSPPDVFTAPQVDLGKLKSADINRRLKHQASVARRNCYPSTNRCITPNNLLVESSSMYNAERRIKTRCHLSTSAHACTLIATYVDTSKRGTTLGRPVGALQAATLCIDPYELFYDQRNIQSRCCDIYPQHVRPVLSCFFPRVFKSYSMCRLA